MSSSEPGVPSTTSTRVVLAMSRASARQSNPAPRLAVVAGASTVTDVRTSRAAVAVASFTSQAPRAPRTRSGGR